MDAPPTGEPKDAGNAVVNAMGAMTTAELIAGNPTDKFASLDPQSRNSLPSDNSHILPAEKDKVSSGYKCNDGIMKLNITGVEEKGGVAGPCPGGDGQEGRVDCADVAKLPRQFGQAPSHAWLRVEHDDVKVTPPSNLMANLGDVLREVAAVRPSVQGDCSLSRLRRQPPQVREEGVAQRNIGAQDRTVLARWYGRG